MTLFNSTAEPGLPMPTVRRWVRPVVHAVSDAIPLLIRLSIGLAFAYGATIAYGLAAGYALPTATIFFLLPIVDFVTRLEALLPRAILLIAFLGMSAGWLARWSLADSSRVRRNEIAGIRLLRRWGLLLIGLTLILALSDGGWSGRITRFISAGDDFRNYASLAGLIPNSDANYHFLSPLEQVLTGSWSSFGSRRPLATGFRQLTLASMGFSFVGALLLQAVIISAALFAAARSIVLWRGLWSGFAFCALIYVLVRPFLASVLTEPLGLIWALLSIMFLVEAMRLKAIRYAYLALITLALAEAIRMGSLFTVPAFVLWVAVAFASTMRDRLRVLAIGSALVALVLLLQSLCAILYGSPAGATGGNFASSLCGLAVGGDWTTCPQMFAQEFSRFKTENDQAAFLYSKATQLISGNPEILMSKMVENAYNFVTGIPRFVLFGYQAASRPLQELGLVALVPGMYFALWRKGLHRELAFWVLMFASMILSASIIFTDDGWRVMYSTWPLVVLFLCLGFASPAVVTLPPRFRAMLSASQGTALIAVVMALVVAIPGLNRIWPGAELAGLSKLKASQDVEQAILVGRTLTGFLVIPDDAAEPKAVPALHATDFANLVQIAGMERDYGEFLEGSMKHLPFAFMTAARADDPEHQYVQYYVAPAEILTDRRSMGWRVTIGNNLHNRFVHDVTAIRRLP